MAYVPGSLAVVVKILCFDCSAWASLFYGFTADVSESIDYAV